LEGSKLALAISKAYAKCNHARYIGKLNNLCTGNGTWTKGTAACCTGAKTGTCDCTVGNPTEPLTAAALQAAITKFKGKTDPASPTTKCADPPDCLAGLLTGPSYQIEAGIRLVTEQSVPTTFCGSPSGAFVASVD